MDIILIPGLWLDGSSWEPIVPKLEQAGHRVHPITLPGMEAQEADRSDVSLSDWIEAVVETIDDTEHGPVLLVGHSAGGGVAHAAVDARPDRVARVIYIGGFPTPDGQPIVDGFTIDGPNLPLPDWEAFDEADVDGLDDQARLEIRRRAIPAPTKVITDRQKLSNDRRYDVPATVICPEFTSQMLQGWIEQDLDPVRELARIRHLEFVDLPTGHWPQFSKPDDLGRAIAERAYEPQIDEHGRIHPEADMSEALSLLGFLDYQRATLDWKARGLDSAGLRTPTAASSLTLGALLKHMAWVEDYWFSFRMHGRDPSPPWNSVDWSTNPDWEFTSAAENTPEELWRLWRTATARSRALVAAAIAEGGMEGTAARGAEGEKPSLRWILLHMIEEYARHNGHADLLRETIDGQTGE
jgi:pimeloyl-ACP methyl ester carboxylesterase